MTRCAGLAWWTAADTTRPPDLGDLCHRARRRRVRPSTADVPAVAAVMVGVPVGVAVAAAPAREPQLAHPRPRLASACALTARSAGSPIYRDAERSRPVTLSLA
jgi:hypothetical protein